METEESGMKLWEVMSFLEENPTDVYEAQLNDWGGKARMTAEAKYGKYYYKFEVFDGERLVDQSQPSRSFNDNVALDLDWQLVRQPVTWQEAIQAWGAGRIVSVDVGGCKFKLTHDDSIFGLSERMINLGTWYVEFDDADDQTGGTERKQREGDGWDRNNC